MTSPTNVGGYDGVKVFSTTMIRDRERMGEEITDWLRAHLDYVPVITIVRQSSDAGFHCLSILIFWRLERSTDRGS